MTTVDADNFFGMTPSGEPSLSRLTAASIKGGGNLKLPGVAEVDSAGLSVVWAPENTRGAIFDAMRRKEVYATTGPRITVRLRRLGLQAGRCDPLGLRVLRLRPRRADGWRLVGCAKGPDADPLDQDSKGSRGRQSRSCAGHQGLGRRAGRHAREDLRRRLSGDRKAGADGRLPQVGNTVDSTTGSYSNSIGASTLSTAWSHPAFDPAERAYYYIRVIEIPTPRWTTYDAVRFGQELPKNLPPAVTQRAYTPAGVEKVLYSFGSVAGDGTTPQSSLVNVHGTLYGTTVYGGNLSCSSGCGTVFSVTQAGVETVLHAFTGGSDGSLPVAGLIYVGGILYGTTSAGGTFTDCNGGCGTVFSVTSAGVEKVMHSFGGFQGGRYPYGNLLSVADQLYGTAEDGGASPAANKAGTVFSMTRAGGQAGVMKLLHSFSGSSDGAHPYGGVIDLVGTLYGATYQGGALRHGTIFKVTP
jgi:uncharacterized repeat protein (TIGR03803 family)